jgi:hypothetical protein
VGYAELCSGESSTTSLPLQIPEALDALIGTQAFNPLIPTPGDPNHFMGNVTIQHSEDPTPEGTDTLDVTLRWDLRRTLR